MQGRGVGGVEEWLLVVVAEAEGWSGPGGGVDIAPQDVAALCGEFVGEGAAEPDEAVVDEVSDLCVVEHAVSVADARCGRNRFSRDRQGLEPA
ncbi:hypothetical protein [Nocardia cyriacigeorgica]|uniref:hypothetical protein n=1 Tax=Nocardia cyriacigeorgica TaxID=135487 RepID=UPI002457628A|nr:hypothetical protein [Nocardia cyriacigeorgica]